YVLLPTLAGLKAIDVSVEEASQNLGASRWRAFWTVSLPLVVPSVLAGALLVFIETLENFGVPFVLAEDKPILAVEAFKLFVGETDQNPASAGVLGVLLVTLTALVLLIQRRYLGRRRFATGARRSPPVLAVSGGLVPRPGAAGQLQPRQLHRSVLALGAAARQHADAVDDRGLCRGGDRRAGRLRRDALPLLADDGARRRRDDAVRGRRHGARHRAHHRLQRRLDRAHRRLADHGRGLCGAEAAVLGAGGEQHPPSDRPEPRGGLDQPGRLAAHDLRSPHRAADARRHRRRHGADLRHRVVRAELDRRALQRPVAEKPWHAVVRETLKQNDVRLVPYVPDRVLTPLIKGVHEDGFFTAFATTREEEAVGIVAGAWMAGLRGAVLMQTSGFATLANVLASLVVPCQIPLVMIVSERGTLGEFNLGQAMVCRTMRPVLDALGIESHTLQRLDEVAFVVDRSIKQALATQAPCALILSPLLTGGKTFSQ
ncbi:MAG: ABC transporter permease subunit, partial [Bradyrhizobium sp.]|nr:ABC transporter permease subunit [Bradyrhizobium sp.]